MARARKLIGTRKVGHAGTLDPMATGLLVLGVNSSTRLLTFIVGLPKRYTATIRLGAVSTTDDAEGQLGPRAGAAVLAAISEEAIAAGIRELTGDISQRPSSVSAIKVDGKRAYARVREGEDIVLTSRPVTISTFDVLEVRRGEWLDLDVLVDCSSGTYIRALARDLGESLGVGGHLTVLRRTSIGPFAVADASVLDDSLAARLIDPARVARVLFAVVDLDEAQARDLAHGKRIPLPHHSGTVAAIGPGEHLVGIVQLVEGRAHVIANFPPDQAAGSPPHEEQQ